MEKLDKFDSDISKFLKVVKAYAGAKPIFSFDYAKKRIILKDASSGFLKILYRDDDICAHLETEGITLHYFS